jgi:hypothetical protein
MIQEARIKSQFMHTLSHLRSQLQLPHASLAAALSNVGLLKSMLYQLNPAIATTGFYGSLAEVYTHITLEKNAALQKARDEIDRLAVGADFLFLQPPSACYNELIPSLDTIESLVQTALDYDRTLWRYAYQPKPDTSTTAA